MTAAGDARADAAGRHAPLLNVRINEAEAVVLRRHLLSCHRSLFEAVLDGPLNRENLDAVPIDVLSAIHTACHLGCWASHLTDDWLYDPVGAATSSPPDQEVR